MSDHAITFEALADWLDGRLEPGERRGVDDHLATGCTACGQSLAWLRRFEEAGRLQGYVQPPAHLVARAKASYRARPARAARSLWQGWRLAPALGALALAAAILLALVGTPTVFAREAVVASAAGRVEAGTGGGSWQPIGQDERLHEGERIRAVEGPATVALYGGATLEMEPGAEVTLASLRSGLFGVAQQVTLYQAGGAVAYDVPSLRAGLESFQVQTATGLVAVHGTRFVVRVTATAQTMVTVMQGSVLVTGPLDSAAVTTGEAVLIEAGAPLQLQPTPAPAATPQARPSGQPGNGPGPAATPKPAQTAQPGGPGPGATLSPQPDPGGAGTPRPAATAQAGPPPAEAGTARPQPTPGAEGTARPQPTDGQQGNGPGPAGPDAGPAPWTASPGQSHGH